MKRLTRMALPVAACFSMISCDWLNKPLGGTDAYNPLDAPGTDTENENSDPFGPTFSPGTFLETVSPKTSFFTTFPREGDQPTKYLANYTDVKVVSTKGTYAKVEVVDTGEVGYVPSVMLGVKRAPSNTPAPKPTDVPGLPGNEQPVLPPEPKPEGLVPPEVVDPSRPAE